MYLAYTAPHWPLHALEEDIALFEERYLKGWDILAIERMERMQKMGLIDQGVSLPPKPEGIPEWEALSEEEKKKQARLMAVYAAMIYRMDAGIGQVIGKLKEKGLYENTVIMFASDNGATDANISRRGLNDPNVPIGARGSYVAYREPWAWLSNTPYQNYKKSSYWGGMRTPFIISYPKLTQNQRLLSSQAGHFVDVLPTALHFAHASPPEGYQSEGIDLSAVVAGADSGQSLPRPVFMEHMGNKAVIYGNWKLLRETYETEWSLFNLEKDPLEVTNLAPSNPEKVSELEQLYLHWEQRTGSYTLPDKYLE
jgi:arylsulfatase